MSLKFKRSIPLMITLVLVLSFLTLGIGSQRIVAYTVQGNEVQVEQSQDISGSVALFDDTVVHSIQLLIPDEDYDTMMTTYQETGEKDYFHADVIIDGVRINDVGVRLKGNASLRTAAGGKGGMEGIGGMGGDGANGDRPQFDPGNMPEGGGRGQRPDFGNAPDGGNFPGMPGDGNGQQQLPTDENGNVIQPPDSGNFPGMPGDGNGQQMPTDENGNAIQMPGGGNMGGGFGGGINSEDAKIPLMIKFDKYVENQTYQGYSLLAIRTYGISSDASMLQEPVTNAMARLAGLPATHTAYISFQRNDETAEIYTISEVIDEKYLEDYLPDGDGVLYKAELGASLTYKGEDPTSYSGQFTQQTRVNDADLAPLIKFMSFLDESDDAAFESELPSYLDVDSFATYLALNNLLVNTDSIVGMNNNYYLYYSEDTQKFTLLMWDANESLGKLNANEKAATYDIYYEGTEGIGKRMGGKNTLVTRFFNSEKFTALYEEKLEVLYQQIFTSGAIENQVDTYADLIRTANVDNSLVDSTQYESAVTKVKDFITGRSAYLASTPLLNGLTSTIP